MKTSRWFSRAAAAVLSMAVFCPQAMLHAQDYPARTIRLIIPFAPGGPTDVLGRLVAQKMSEDLGQPMVVENRPGAGGSTGISVVVKSAPDGYTLGYGSASTLAINASIYKLDYDPVKDLAPIGLVAVGPYTIVTHPSRPSNLKDFVAHVKGRPGKVNMGSSGIGSSPHITAVLFNDAIGLDVVHIPYKGGAPGLAAVMSGEVDYIFDAPVTSKALADAGKILILAVTSLERSSVLPNVPTVSEALLPGFSATTWNGLVAPPGTPAPVIARLSKSLRGVVQLPEVQERLKLHGYSAYGNSPDEFAKFIREEAQKWSSAVRKAKIAAE